jgi:Ala-tRNA(Pro) deacylase
MKDIYEILASLHIDYRRHDHPAVFTVEQADLHKGAIEGGQSKNLFLRNKKGQRHYLLVAEAHRPVHLKPLQALLDESTLSFASPERLMKYLGLTPGAVSPFGIVNDAQHEVVVLLDRGLMAHERLNFHPNVNTTTLTVSRQDFEKFLAHCGNEVRLLELPAENAP